MSVCYKNSDVVLGYWSEWSICDSICDNGMQTRSRNCLHKMGSAPCTYEQRSCSGLINCTEYEMGDFGSSCDDQCSRKGIVLKSMKKIIY